MSNPDLQEEFNIAIKERQPARLDNTLCLAAGEGRLDMVKDLIAAGASARAMAGEPMNWAAKSGSMDVVRYLEAQGGMVVKDDSHMPLEMAVVKNHSEIVSYFLKHKSTTETHKNKALITASDCGHLSLVKTLIQSGADYKYKDYEASRAARNSSRPDITDYLVALRAVDKIKKDLSVSPDTYAYLERYTGERLLDEKRIVTDFDMQRLVPVGLYALFSDKGQESYGKISPLIDIEDTAIPGLVWKEVLVMAGINRLPAFNPEGLKKIDGILSKVPAPSLKRRKRC